LHLKDDPDWRLPLKKYMISKTGRLPYENFGPITGGHRYAERIINLERYGDYLEDCWAVRTIEKKCWIMLAKEDSQRSMNYQLELNEKSRFPKRLNLQ